MPYCTHCGAEMADDARICPNCNRPVQAQPPPPVPPVGQPSEVPPAAPGQAVPSGPQTFPGPPVAARRTDGAAVTSLVLGILGIVFCPLILSIPAIIVGRSSERRIRESGGLLDGEGLAKAGWITGIVGTVLGVIYVAIMVLFLGAILQLEAGSPAPAPFLDLIIPPR